MKIIFYSTNSNQFDDTTFHINTFPSANDIFNKFTENHPDDDFYVVTQKPCFFLPDNINNSQNIIIMPQESSIEDMAKKIIDINPDMAIAMTFWVDPFDWLTINDSLVAELLEQRGIKTISHNVKTGMICFDKTKTHNKLKALGFNVPEAVFVDHDMYFCAGSNKKVIHNVYKDYIKSQIQKLTLPLIIKDTVGVSSYGAAVVHSYGEAMGYLNSKRNNSDRIIEEYITGRQFGTEIYGTQGCYTIMPPVEFSLNQYGITSPKLSIKYGAVTEDDLSGALDNSGIKDLYDNIRKLAEALEFRGIAQIDLVYSNNKWYIIEINPRLSGMSYTYSCLLGKSLYEIIYESLVKKEQLYTPPLKKVLNIKLPVLTLETGRLLSQISHVNFVHITNDQLAKQEREKGYCEVIITGNTALEIKEALEKIKTIIPEEISDTALSNSFLASRIYENI